jgi:hypothetical protein
MVRKTPATPAKKAPEKRKPAKTNPVTPVAVEPWQNWQRHLTIAAASLVMLLIGAVGGVWSAGGIEIGPGRDDIISKSFDEYETLWRAAQVAAADKLDSGEFTKSQQVTEYRSVADGAAIKKTRQPLLDAEFAEFGGDKWTAEKASKVLRGYGQ